MPSIQDLNQKFPIVNPDGTPTDYFMRLLMDRGESTAETIDTVEKVIAELPNKADKVTNLIAGLGLDGGGDLSADRTFDLNAGLDDLTDVDLSTPPTDGQVLTYDNGSSLWVPETPSGGGGGGGPVLIEEKILTSTTASLTFAAIPGTYKDLRLMSFARQDATGVEYIFTRLNGDTGANYRSYVENRFGYANFTDRIRFGNSCASTQPAGHFTQSDGWFYNYASATTQTTTFSMGYGLPDNFIDRNAAIWNNTAPVTSISVQVGTGVFAIGSIFRLYGYP